MRTQNVIAEQLFLVQCQHTPHVTFNLESICDIENTVATFNQFLEIDFCLTSPKVNPKKIPVFIFERVISVVDHAVDDKKLPRPNDKFLPKIFQMSFAVQRVYQLIRLEVGPLRIVRIESCLLYTSHVVTFDDELQRIADEIVWNQFEDRVFIGTDFFDASINRIAAWAIGLRNTRKALLFSALAPYKEIRQAEYDADYTLRLALQEERKNLPATAVWNYYCLQQDVPQGSEWIADMKNYEQKTLVDRI